MQLTTPVYLAYVLVALFALTHSVSANFDLYVFRGEKDTVFPWPDWIGGWYIDEYDQPWCDEIDPKLVYEVTGWPEKKDLSHNRLGIRCEPWDHCGIWHYEEDPWPLVNLVEMHFTNEPLYHFTIYKDRGYMDGTTWKWPLFGVDGNKYGECFVFTGQDFNCSWKEGHMRMWGQRKFRCLTGFSAKEIKEARAKDPNRNTGVVEDGSDLIVSHNSTGFNDTVVT